MALRYTRSSLENTSNLPRVAIVGTKLPTVGHKSLSSIGAGGLVPGCEGIIFGINRDSPSSGSLVNIVYTCDLVYDGYSIWCIHREII